MASIEKRTRRGQLPWPARFRDPAGAQKVKVFDRRVDAERAVGFTVSPHSLRHYVGASRTSRGVSVVALSHRLGHPSSEITDRLHAYLKPDAPLCSEQGSQ